MSRKILYFPTKNADVSQLRRYASGKKISVSEIKRNDLGRVVGEICGVRRIGGYPEPVTLPALWQPPSLLLFHDFTDSVLYETLDEISDISKTFDIKAVVTIHNVSWTVQELIRELQQEHAEIGGRP